MFTSVAERLSKRIAVTSLAFAIPLHLYVDPVAGLTVRIAAALAFAASLFCAKRWRLTPLIVATAAAIAPVLLAALTGTAALNVFSTVVLTALFGALLPTLPRDTWQLPPSWRLPMVAWALTLSFGWPVMIVREAGLRLGGRRYACVELIFDWRRGGFGVHRLPFRLDGRRARLLDRGEFRGFGRN